MPGRHGALILALLVLIPSPASSEELRVTGWKANVRASASRSSAVIATLDRGATLEVLGRKGSWHRVRIPSSREVGYVHASMVEIVPRVASAPVAQAPPVPRPRAIEPAPRPTLPPPKSRPPVVPAEPPIYRPPPPPPPPAATVEVIEEEPELRFRAFGQGAFMAFNARDSFDAIFGSSTGATFGGGLEVKYRHFFLQLALDRFRKTGERVFIFEGEVFPLGIDDRVTITPLSVFVGYRFLRLGPATLYAGLGVGSYKLQETFAFADAEETVDDRFTGYQGRVGAEVRVHKWVNVAAEIEYATVPSSLGTGGVSEIFAEENLRGASFRIRVLVGP